MEASLALLVCAIIVLGLLQIGKGFIDHAKHQREHNNLLTIAQACREYYQKEGHWPAQVRDLQPFFLSREVDVRHIALNPQDNLIQVSSLTDHVTVVKPHGLTGGLNYL